MTRILICFAVVLLAGCQKFTPATINNVDVPSLSSKTLEYSGYSKEQKVRVTASSAGSFTVYVALQKDVPAVIKAIDDIDTPKNLLAKQEKTKNANLTFSVPAQTPFAVVLANSGNSDVSVQVKVVPE